MRAMMCLRRLISAGLGILGIAGWMAACATSPLGRRQFQIVPDAMMDQMGSQSFTQLKSQTPVERDPAWNTYVRCITLPLIRESGSKIPPDQWEIVVFRDRTANAFALPGGKIGVHTGIFPVAKTDGQLAAVLGHEVGHVLAGHGNERVSQSLGVNLGLSALSGLLSSRDEGDRGNKNILIAALGMGAQIGVLLPFSRTHESEADLIGLDLMARSGFDPRESAALWRNMIALNGRGGPELLSTHPASENRIRALEENFSSAIPKFEAAKAEGRLPHCARPG